jgi:uncharacterized membrane protein YcaP (DUF421 family)
VDKERIHWWDLHRIFIGQAPLEFLLEVFIRSLILYVMAIVIMRWLGKRMNGQLSILELAIMVMMGATLGAPMQIPDRGILQALVIFLAILMLLRLVNLLAFHNRKAERMLNGRLSILVKDGVIQTDQLEKDRLSKPQLYASLRTNGIFNLGRVKRMYLEPYGSFAVYEEKEKRPGLLLYPERWNGVLPPHKTVETAIVCKHCGTVVNSTNEKQNCPNCNHVEWDKPIIEES